MQQKSGSGRMGVVKRARGQRLRGFLANVLCAAVLILMHADGRAIVIRHDVDASDHLVAARPPAYLVDLPHEGHAVLVAERWLLTVAHTIFYDYTGVALSIGGESYTISRVIVHPDYQTLPEHLLKGDSKPLMQFLSARADIALIELTQPVSGATPIALYRGADEVGMRVDVYGRGSTGDGVVGEVAASKADRVLRRCENRITEVFDRWLSYRFDEPKFALPLEGMHGSGDSGGPSVVTVDGQRFLVGLSSWQYYDGDLGDFVGGRYGTAAFQVRVSAFADWIHGHVSGRRAQAASEVLPEAR